MYIIMNVILSLLGIAALIYMLFNRQYATAFLMLGVAFVFWFNMPEENVVQLVMNDIPVSIENKDYDRVITSISNIYDSKYISNFYISNDKTKRHELIYPVSDIAKNCIFIILQSVGYQWVSDSPFHITFWIPTSLEPGTSTPMAMSIRLNGTEHANTTYRLFAQYNPCILISNNITSKNFAEKADASNNNKAYSTNLLFEGALTDAGNEIISKKVTLECLKDSRTTTTVTFVLEKKIADKKWVEEPWRQTTFEIHIRNKIFSDLSEISFLIGFVGSIITILFQFIDALKKRKLEI